MRCTAFSSLINLTVCVIVWHKVGFPFWKLGALWIPAILMDALVTSIWKKKSDAQFEALRAKAAAAGVK